ncbi:hypothetical protein JZ785_27640 (plasmid) [Alicyclobacillus curvatus]|nr:hypothetical protein JZ785_27640 [Alicyclobacillus curvatus]
MTKAFPRAVTDNIQETIAAAETYLGEFHTMISKLLSAALFLPEEQEQSYELFMQFVGTAIESAYFRGVRNGVIAAEHGLDLSDMLSQQPALTVIDGGKKSE